MQVCGDEILKFDISLNISPLQDTIILGDTLWLTMSIPDFLNDINSNENIRVLEFDFKIKHGLNRMDINMTPRAYQEFEFIDKVGTYEILNIGTGGRSSKSINRTDTRRAKITNWTCTSF